MKVAGFFRGRFREGGNNWIFDSLHYESIKNPYGVPTDPSRARWFDMREFQLQKQMGFYLFDENCTGSGLCCLLVWRPDKVVALHRRVQIIRYS